MRGNMKKISIIIPNYNGDKFIRSCLDSVSNQDYPNKEVIVVDDGSTDDSVKIVRQFMKENKKLDMKLICQDNLNAAVARNNGMKKATGDLVVFLDSDDLLRANVVSKLIAKYEKNDADLLIGGYEEISEGGEHLKDKNFSDVIIAINPRKEFSELANMDPVPSNKIYNLKLIRKNNLQWGNVRIGQDLNFYLKYLAICKKVLLTSEIVYRYRIVQGSMSRTYNSKIFDIVKVFPDVEDFYVKTNNEALYKQYIPVLMVKHFNFQLYKQVFYTDLKTRKKIVNYFREAERRVDYTSCVDKLQLSKILIKFRLKCIFRIFYTSSWYCHYKLWRIKHGK